MSYHIISCHIISYHIISYHIKRRFCLCIQQYSYHVSLRSHAGVERSRGIAPFGGQDETQGFCASHGLHLGLPGCPAATFRTTFFGQSSGATGPVCRTIRKASWPWAIDSSGRRLPWDVCRLCHAVLTLCHAVRWPGQVRLISCWFDAAGLAALGKGERPRCVLALVRCRNLWSLWSWNLGPNMKPWWWTVSEFNLLQFTCCFVFEFDFCQGSW